MDHFQASSYRICRAEKASAFFKVLLVTFLSTKNEILPSTPITFLHYLI